MNRNKTKIIKRKVSKPDKLHKKVNYKKDKINRYQEFFINLTNFFLDEWKSIAEKIILSHPEITGFSISNNTKFIYHKSLFFKPVFKLNIVDISLTTFNELIVVKTEGLPMYQYIKKENKQAEMLLNELINAIETFNRNKNFYFIKVYCNTHNNISNSECSISLLVSLSDLDKMFNSESEQNGQTLQKKTQT